VGHPLDPRIDGPTGLNARPMRHLIDGALSIPVQLALWTFDLGGTVRTNTDDYWNLELSLGRVLDLRYRRVRIDLSGSNLLDTRSAWVSQALGSDGRFALLSRQQPRRVDLSLTWER